MYKIFINDKPLFLVDNLDDFQPTSSNILIQFQGEEEILKAISSLETDSKITSLAVHGDDVNQIWESFRSQYKMIEAAGGLVQHENGKYLLIYRKGKWDLPKGKLEKSETPNVAALREVEEECGITNVKIEEALPNTYHTYELRGKNILKVSYWFSMSYSGNETPVPQLNEGIEKAEWCNSDDIKQALTNAYSSIQEMLNKVV
ncbi:MAG: NUDIX domain-containing protein [Flavobacteriales bacterium]|nr:NUDIX domain-containing protein [Flavobacteriales bacterium]